jgi:hypothetical protein
LAACRISADGRLVLGHRGERVHGLLGSRTEVTATSQRAQTGECSKGAREVERGRALGWSAGNHVSGPGVLTGHAQ